MKIEVYFRTANQTEFAYYNTIEAHSCEEDLEFEAMSIAEEYGLENNDELFIKLICNKELLYYKMKIEIHREPIFFVRDIEKYEKNDTNN